MNGRKAKKLRRVQTERRMVSLAASASVADSSAVCESVYNWVRAARKAYDLTHITFVFPMIKTLYLSDWFDPAGAMAVMIAKRRDLITPHSYDERAYDERAYSLRFQGESVVDAEFSVNHDWGKKLRGVGCLAIYEENGYKVKIPAELAYNLANRTMGLVCVPPFHRGGVPSWEIILKMQEASANISLKRRRNHDQ